MSTNNSDIGVCANTYATSLFSAAGLSQARQLLRYEDTYLISLPTEYLWESYQLDDQVLTNVRQHLITESWLTENGGWDPAEVDRNQFDVSGDAFDFFPRLFNAVLGYLQRTGSKTSLVKTMMNSANVGPESTGDIIYQPDAFFHMTTDPTSMPDKFRWRDLTCPFEYKFDDGHPVNVSQPESIDRWDHIFILRRTTTRRCGPSSISCVLTLVGCSRLDAPYKAQSSASGCYPEWRPSRLSPLTGSMLVRPRASCVKISDNSPRTMTHFSSSSSCLLPPPKQTLVLIRILRALTIQIPTLSLRSTGGNIATRSYYTTLASAH